jgi:HPt (histidine-containing phosphotransfer) domain-containing protein
MAGMREALSAIAGLDSATGLRSTRGHLPNFLLLLRQFVGKYGDDDLRGMEAQMNDGDAATLIKLAHRFKGAASMLGLRQLRDQAASLESALREGHAAAGLAADVGRLRSDFDALAAAVASLPDETSQ